MYGDGCTAHVRVVWLNNLFSLSENLPHRLNTPMWKPSAKGAGCSLHKCLYWMTLSPVFVTPSSYQMNQMVLSPGTYAPHFQQCMLQSFTSEMLGNLCVRKKSLFLHQEEISKFWLLIQSISREAHNAESMTFFTDQELPQGCVWSPFSI